MPLLKSVKWEKKITLGDLVTSTVVIASLVAYIVTVRNDVSNLQAEMKDTKPLVMRHEKNLAIINEKLQLKDMQ